MPPLLLTGGRKLLDSKWLRGLLLACLLVVLAWTLSRTFWMLLEGPQDKVSLSAQMTLVGAPGAAAANASMSRADVVSWALFGTPVVTKAGAVEREDAPETRLNLTLLGVFAHVQGKLAGAIIAANGKPGKLYHPGDDLPGNASLYKVYPDKVLIQRAGHTEALSFDMPDLNGSIAATETPVDTRTPADSGILQQRSMVISQLALQPVTVGAAQGYKVTPKIRKDVQAAVGLRPGDVIMAVNGLPVGTPQADQAAMQSFYDSGKAKVRIKRGNSQVTLTYPP